MANMQGLYSTVCAMKRQQGLADCYAGNLKNEAKRDGKCAIFQ